MKTEKPLNKSLLRAFLLQLTIISVVAVGGVYIAEFAIREVLIVSALKREAEYFWSRNSIDRETPPPNTNTLIGYLFDKESGEVPAEFVGLNPGIHDFISPVNRGVVHVSENQDARLYLVFDADNVGELATYFGIIPLAILLVFLYSSAWGTYVLIHRAVSPVILLARTVKNIDLERPQIDAFLEKFKFRRLNLETLQLAGAIDDLLKKVDTSIERERTFTREASHELRTPLTVMRIAASSLKKREPLDQDLESIVEKIERATTDMEELTEVLLLLARDYDGALIKEKVIINDIVKQEISNCSLIYGDKPLEYNLQEEAILETNNSPKLVSIIFGNIIRNAFVYTDSGNVVVNVDANSVSVSDSGIGMTEEQLFQVMNRNSPPSFARGNGIGLNLVKRIIDRFGWHLELKSEVKKGTTVKIRIDR
jgi:signal transduction histidine kinase